MIKNVREALKVTDCSVAGISGYFWCRDRCSMPGRLGREECAGEREGRGEKPGEGGKWSVLIDGLWLAHIIHYLGHAPELFCVSKRGMVHSA